jgi:hypothetical protein
MVKPIPKQEKHHGQFGYKLGACRKAAGCTAGNLTSGATIEILAKLVNQDKRPGKPAPLNAKGAASKSNAIG